MIAIVTTSLLAAAVIEISGLPALVVLLVPVVVLLVVILRLYRASPPAAPATTRETLHAVPAAAAARSGPAAPAVPEPQPLDWALRIRSAEASNDQAALASLYLSVARAEIAEGRSDAAAEHLRASVRAAVKSGNNASQAEARLELAELARAAGDLTTACEHWQLARALFYDLKDERLGKTETLMQKHGCPTDWVLNDF